jgi:hypothetical protein
MTLGRCVCGHPWHDADDAGDGACAWCGCMAYIAAHLPGQVMLGEGE